MERLQAAIEKARAQRGQARNGGNQGGGNQGGAAAGPEPGPGSEAARLEEARLEEARLEEAWLDEAWAALRPIDTTVPAFARGDIPAFRAGGAGGAYDILRTRMVQQAEARGWRRIAVVSPTADAGKTTTVANLAFSLGRQGDYRSLVIDFDLRRVGLARALGQTLDATMADVIEGRTPFAAHGLRHGENVAFGLNSQAVARSSEILQSQRARAALTALEAAYRPDFILFDVPPLFAADDSIGFLRQVDCALIVVAAEETPMSQIDTAERQVAELTQVMGIVLNKCRMTSDGYSYDYAGS